MPPLNSLTALSTNSVFDSTVGIASTTATTIAAAAVASPLSSTLTFPLARCAGLSGSSGEGGFGAAVTVNALRNCQRLLSAATSSVTNYGNGDGNASSSISGLGDSSGGETTGGGLTTSLGLDSWNLNIQQLAHDDSSIFGAGSGVVGSSVGFGASSIGSSNSNSVVGGFGSSVDDGLNDTGNELQAFYDELLASPEMRLRDQLIRYLYPIIIILGNITNVIVLLVFRRQKLRSTSVAFYLSAYAIANLCVLDLMLGVTWVCIEFQITYITMLTDWTCRLWTFITNVMTYTGIWLVVVVNIDRLIYIKSPVKAQGYCTVFSAKTIVSFVLIGLVVVSIHAMWTYELQPQGCFVSFLQDLHTTIWPWWSATVYSYIPLVLLLVLSLVQLATLLIRSVQQQSSLTMRPYGGGDNFVAAVLIISISFFVLTVPTTAINLVDIHLPSEWLQMDLIARIELAQTITEMLSSLNNSILGIILFTCSGDFRAEMFALFQSPCWFCWCCCCCANNRTLKGLEMRNINSKSEDSSPHIQVDYELCNNNEESHVTNV